MPPSEPVSPQRRREIVDALRRGTVPQRGLDVFAVGLGRFEAAIDDVLSVDGVKAIITPGLGNEAGRDGPAISEEEHEVVLSEERAVVETVVKPVERVRLGTETVTEEETVTGEVRTEHIETEGDFATRDATDGDLDDRDLTDRR